MKLLVLVTDYPDVDGKVSLMYVHTRNKYYVKKGIDVTVLNFSSQNNYILDGVKVIGYSTFKKQDENYDIYIAHAANIRQHYFFLKNHRERIPHLVMFFHGHEIMHLNTSYPKPYKYNKKSKLKFYLQSIYDVFKIKVWKYYIQRNLDYLDLVFVSEWMYTEFLKNTHFDNRIKEKIDGKAHIIYNSVGKVFEKKTYRDSYEKRADFDFITVRNNLDGSKYAIDVVVELARLNPNYNFLIIGKGHFFEHFEKPKNVMWINTSLSHEKLIEYLDRSRVALLPTRTDAQGVMACEVASYGIPLITSNIEVCREVFDGFSNVEFINNDSPGDLTAILRKFEYQKDAKNEKFFAHNTIEKEINLFYEIKERN